MYFQIVTAYLLSLGNNGFENSTGVRLQDTSIPADSGMCHNLSSRLAFVDTLIT